VGDDVRQRGLAQARRAEQQHMVHRFGAALGRLDEDFELAADFLLADVIRQPLGPQRALEHVFLRRLPAGRNQTLGCGLGELVGLDAHVPSLAEARQEDLESSFKAARMPSETEISAGRPFMAVSASRSL
jgi:hypothetical protein